jgi:dihydrodipicolinate reductase
MQIVILGYGKMGHEIEKYCASQNIDVSKILKNTQELESYNFSSSEIVIDFTNRDSFLQNIQVLCKKVVQRASKILSKFTEFDPLIHESHHKFKKDAPSGTANSLNGIMQEYYKKEIPVSSTRAGYIVGHHEVIFDSPLEQIKLSHEAKDRAIFAKGAVFCANWLMSGQKKQGIFNIKDIFNNL